jgi:hypothetical protein
LAQRWSGPTSETLPLELSEPEPEPEPELELELEPEPELGPEPESESESELGPEPESESELGPELEPGLQGELERAEATESDWVLAKVQEPDQVNCSGRAREQSLQPVRMPGGG